MPLPLPLTVLVIINNGKCKWTEHLFHFRRQVPKLICLKGLKWVKIKLLFLWRGKLYSLDCNGCNGGGDDGAHL